MKLFLIIMFGATSILSFITILTLTYLAACFSPRPTLRTWLEELISVRVLLLVPIFPALLALACYFWL